MKKYYNFETTVQKLKDELTVFLKQNNIYYEVSSLYPSCGWHFEVLCDEKELQLVNNWLDVR